MKRTVFLKTPSFGKKDGVLKGRSFNGKDGLFLKPRVFDTVGIKMAKTDVD